MAQEFTISGKVKDVQNGEELIGATVFVKSQKMGTVSNEYGYFSLTLPQGEYELIINYIGFKSIHKTVIE